MKRLMPESLVDKARMLKVIVQMHTKLIEVSFNDYCHYRKYAQASFCASKSESGIAAMIIMEAHCIEKAFSLPEMRPGYGRERIENLIALMNRYTKCGHNVDSLALRKAKAVLSTYSSYHKSIEYDLGDISALIEPWLVTNTDYGGYAILDRKSLMEAAKGNFKSLALSRYSIRQYSSCAIDFETISEVIDIARKTPSVCNRQGWHVYVTQDDHKKKAILELQSGNRGFGHNADCLFVVTVDIAAFTGPYERNEAFIDGGLFSMSVLYALHYCGIGACPLNWMTCAKTDSRLRKLISSKPSETAIMIIAAGNIPEEVTVSRSVRYGVGDLMTVIE